MPSHCMIGNKAALRQTGVDQRATCHGCGKSVGLLQLFSALEPGHGSFRLLLFRRSGRLVQGTGSASRLRADTDLHWEAQGKHVFRARPLSPATGDWAAPVSLQCGLSVMYQGWEVTFQDEPRQDDQKDRS